MFSAAKQIMKASFQVSAVKKFEQSVFVCNHMKDSAKNKLQHYEFDDFFVNLKLNSTIKWLVWAELSRTAFL